MYIQLNSLEKVRDFVNNIAQYEEPVNLVSGRYTVDAKSLMGIFSLDLTKPIRVEIDGEQTEDLIQMFDRYSVQIPA